MKTTASFIGCALLLAASACDKPSGEAKPGADAPAASGVKGETAAAPKGKAGVAIDGSSTVYPITEAVAEEFRKVNAKVQVTAGVSGTGGGFKKFCNKETDISGASRPIKPSEVELCQKNGVEYVELPIAYDGLAVMVNPKNDWATSMTVAELKKLWEPEAQGKVKKWSDVRAGWPDAEIRLFGAGVDSGTYDYFTEAIVGKEHSSRGDYTSSEDDNVLVKGVGGDKNALAFFGYAYFESNKDNLKLVPIDDGKDENGKGPIAPSEATIRDGTYQPLARPIFVYVAKASLDKPDVTSFVSFYLDNAEKLVKAVNYVPLPSKAYSLGKKRIADKKTGSLFGGKGSQVGVSIEALLEKESQ